MSDLEAKLSRRLGQAAAAAAAVTTLAGCSDIQRVVRRVTGPNLPEWEPAPPPSPEAAEARAVLRRTTFGALPGDAARVMRMGTGPWLEEQLAAGHTGRYVQQAALFGGGRSEEVLPDDPAVAWRVGQLDIASYALDGPDMLHSLADGQLARELQQAALIRAVYSRWQLHEVMFDFWTNHFNIYALKSDGRVLIPIDAETVIRPNVLGDFGTMLRKSAASPAMLTYLDAKVNRKGIANENYARELLELHTVGVKSGYTIEDIQQVARCFTGWTVEEGWRRGHLFFRPELHDYSAKYIPFLDLHIPARSPQDDGGVIRTQQGALGLPGVQFDGALDGLEVVKRLSDHPATGRFLATKLCRKFLGHAPEPVVQRAAAAFVKSKGSIRPMLRPILLDALRDPSMRRPIYKRPLELAVGALRALHADTMAGAGLQQHLADMAQSPYHWPMPDGFPTKAEAWAGNILPRWNFVMALASGTLDGVSVDLNSLLAAAKRKGVNNTSEALVQTILGTQSSDPEAAPLYQRMQTEWVGRKAEPARIAALIMASPQYQWM
jgi:uncharacterized protein (DUF1800 family)